MPFNSRDLWVVLKAQDQATRALNSFSRSVAGAGNSVRIAQIEAEQAAARAELAQGRLTGMTGAQRAAIENEIATLQAEKAQLQANDAALAGRGNSMRQLEGIMRSTSQTAYAMGFALTSIGVGGIIVMGKLVESSMQYEKAVRLTSTQIDNFGGDLKQLGDIGLRVADTIGVKFEQIQPALYDIFSSIDVSVSESETLLTAFAKAAVAGQTDITSVSRATIGIMNAFHRPVSDINHILDVQFKLVQKGIGTYDEWIGRIGKVSPSAIRAGQSIETMAAALETSTRFGVPAAQSATAVARAFDAFSNPIAVANLKAIGVNALDAQGNFRPFLDVMKEFRDVLNKMPGGQEAKIAAILNVFKGAGGTIEARKFLQTLLLGNNGIELMGELLKDTSNSAGAMENAYGAMADTTATKTEIMKNKWNELKISLGDALIPTFNKVLDLGNRVLDWFNRLSPKTKDLIAKILILVTAFAASGGPVLLLLGFFASLVAAFVAAGPEILAVAGIIAGLAGGFALIGRAIYDVWHRNGDVKGFLVDIGKDAKEAYENYLKPFATHLKDDWETKIKPAFDALKAMLIDEILPIVKQFWDEFWAKHKKDIEELLNWFSKVIDYGIPGVTKAITQLLIPAIENLVEWYQQHKKGVDQVVGGLEWLGKWFMKIAGSSVIGILVIAIISVIIIISTIINWFVGFVNMIQLIIHWISEFIGWLDKIHKRFSDWGGDVTKAIGTTTELFTGLPGRITAAVGNLGNVLVSAGMSVITGLIKGITNMIPALGGVLGAIGSYIVSHKGPPAKDATLLYKSGQLIVGGLIAGLTSMKPELDKTLTGMTNSIPTTVNASVSGQYGTGNTAAPNKTIYNNVVVNTHEINPRQQAIELGFLLAGSV